MALFGPVFFLSMVFLSHSFTCYCGVVLFLFFGQFGQRSGWCCRVPATDPPLLNGSCPLGTAKLCTLLLPCAPPSFAQGLLSSSSKCWLRPLSQAVSASAFLPRRPPSWHTESPCSLRSRLVPYCVVYRALLW
jgi:hypothetical protein